MLAGPTSHMAIRLSTKVDSADRARVAPVHRVESLTGMRAVAALMVVGTHAAYGTGQVTHGYVGLLSSRLEIGVPIFFVLTGFLLFGPWVKAAATGSTPPALRRYVWRRVRRIMPAYVVTVLLVFLVYQFRTAGPNPGHTWAGLFRHVSLTQIYTGNYILTYLHHGLTQMWSLAVEAAFYATLPLLAYLLLTVVCRRRWRPVLLLVSLAGLAALSPAWLIVLHTTDWLPGSAGMWLPAHLACFVGGMALAVLQAIGARCYAFGVIPLALTSYLIVATPIAGDATMAPVELWEPLAKTVFYTIIATLVVAPLALGDRGWYARLVGSRPIVWLGEISYEIFLIHVIVMEVAATSVFRWHVFTGSLAQLFVVTLAITVPLAWALHRVTQPAVVTRRSRSLCQWPAVQRSQLPYPYVLSAGCQRR
jgi:peptidoglycan/LPS O-acetylase OafA/YrhL